jgi:four helix bundle protein
MKGENIATRLLVFGAGVVRLCRRLPDDASAKHIARQLVRAATGGGANYEEARGAESRADFIHKVGIANKELREALYWLRLTEEAALVTDNELAALIRDPAVPKLTLSARQNSPTLCRLSLRQRPGVRLEGARYGRGLRRSPPTLGGGRSHSPLGAGDGRFEKYDQALPARRASGRGQAARRSWRTCA